MSFSKMIASIRENFKLTQQEMASDLSVSFATINRWEQGHNKPSQKRQTEILDFYKSKGFFVDKNKGKSIMFGLTLITARMIEEWCLKDKRKFESFIPELIEKLLIESTDGKIAGLRIPTGDNVWIPGVDGKFTNVNNQIETPFVPSGDVIIEIGTTSGTLKKIDGDFKKRDNTYSYEQKKDTTFILITSKIWAYKEEKSNFEKRINTSWKRVIVYDALDLEKWLSQCLETSVYALEQMENMKIDLKTVDSMWNTISDRTTPKTKESLFLAGRDDEKELILKYVETDTKKRIDIRASSRDEALGFVISSLIIRRNPKNAIIVVNEIVSFKFLSKLVDNNVFIVNFDVEQIDLSPKNRYIFLYGNSSSDNRTYDIKLAERPFSIISKSLSDDLGLDSGLISSISSKCGNNTMCIIRALASEQFLAEPSWRKTNNLVELIPMLILGRIEAYNLKDMELIRFITNIDSNEYLKKISNWKAIDESPLMFIGSSIKVNSSIELWNELHNFIDSRLIERVCECLIKMFNEDLKVTQVSKHSFLKSNEVFSDYSYSGLISFLTINAINSETSTYTINGSVKKILELSKDQRSIKFVCKYYLQLAECSPQIYLDFISTFINNNEDILLSLYKTDNGINSYFGVNDYVHILHSLTALTLLDRFKIQAINILLEIYLLDVKHDLSKSPEDTLVNILSVLNTNNALSINEKRDFLIAQCKKNSNFVHKLIMKVIFSNSILISDGYLKWRIPQTSYQELTNHEIFKFINEVLIAVVDSLGKTDIGIIKEIVENFHFLNSKINQSIENYCINVLTSEDVKFVIYEYLYRKIKQINRFKEKNEYENIINFLSNLMKQMKPTDLFFSNLIHFKTFSLFDEDYHYLSEKKQADKLEFLKQTYAKFNEKYTSESIIEMLAPHLVDDYSSGLMLANILGENEIQLWSSDLAINNRMNLLSYLISYTHNKCDLTAFINSLDYKKKTDLVEKFSLNGIVNFDTTVLTDENLLKAYWENRQLTTKSDANEKHQIKKYNPIAYLHYINYQLKFNEWNVDEILDILINITEGELLKHRDLFHSLEEMISKIDDNLYNEKVVVVAFKFLNMNYHRKLLKSIRKYFFDNPLDLLNLMNVKYELWYKVKMQYYLPDDYSSDNKKLVHFADAFINCPQQNRMDNIIAIQTLGEIFARTSRKNGDIFIPISLRNIIEHTKNEELRRGYLIGYTNTFEARFVDDGTNEREISKQFEEKAKEIELQYPETARIFRMIANDHKSESERIKKDRLIGY